MSVIRLIMVENDKTFSGHIPSASIAAVMWSISEGASNTSTFWEIIKQIDPALNEHFLTNQDNSPILEGFDDGLLVISWNHRCIESFQSYQPIRHIGSAFYHNGLFLEDTQEPAEYTIASTWNIIDHHFEESRH